LFYDKASPHFSENGDGINPSDSQTDATQHELKVDEDVKEIEGDETLEATVNSEVYFVYDDSAGTIEVNTIDVGRLDPEVWFNDTLVLLLSRFQVKTSSHKILVFDPFFLTKYRGKCSEDCSIASYEEAFGNVKSWVKNTDLSAYDLLLFPRNVKKSHWVLMGVSNPAYIVSNCLFYIFLLFIGILTLADSLFQLYSSIRSTVG
jgi:Ulp1 family protease